MKKIESTQTGPGDKPLNKVEIDNSGVINVEKPFEVLKDGVY